MRLAVRIGLAALAVSAACGAAGIFRAQASDHRDAPALLSDPALDIGDVFAFMRPALVDGGNGGTFAPSDTLVLVMTVFPSAPEGARFDPDGEYVFNIAGATIGDASVEVSRTLDVLVSCRFQPAGDAGRQAFICSANGFFFSGETEALSGAPTDPVRAFAGRRADPAFGAPSASLSRLAGGALPLADGGADEFAADNVLAIVAEIDVDRVLFGDAGRRPLAISASTERLAR